MATHGAYINFSRTAFLTTLAVVCGTSQTFATIISPTVTIPGVTYSGNDNTSFFDSSSFLFVSAAGSISSSSGGIGGSAGGNSAHVSFSSALGSPTITASTDAGGSDSLHPSSAGILFLLNYYFVATGPAQTANVDISAAGIKTKVVGGATLQGAVTVFSPPGFSPVHAYVSPIVTATLPDWSANDVPFTVTTDQVYDVQLSLQIGAGAGSSDTFESATVTVDPQFFIDLNQNGNTPADFALFFSDGVANTPGVTAVPEPSGLPVVAAGLGALTLLAWRRQRRPKTFST